MNLDARAERRSEYFGKAERRELEMFPERMEREKERWLDLVDFPTWQILKILQFGDQHVRGILKFFSGSPDTFYDRLGRMEKWGLIEASGAEKGRKTYEITSLGERLLSAFNAVGEVVKEIRGEKEPPVEKMNL